MASTLKLVVEMPEMVTEVDVHGTLDEQPVKTHKSKKPVKDRHKAGRASMISPNLDSPSKLACLDFAGDAPPLLLPPLPTRCAHRPSQARTNILCPVPKGDQEPAKEMTSKSTTVPMVCRTMTAPTTATHGTAVTHR
jgi:hypothetical protein